MEYGAAGRLLPAVRRWGCAASGGGAQVRESFRTFLAAIIAASFTLWLVSLDRGAVFDVVGWTYSAHLSFAVMCFAALLWVWLAVRDRCSSGRPRIPRGMTLRPEFNPQHRPNDREESPWWYVCYVNPTRDFYPAKFRIEVNEVPQFIRAHIAHHEKVDELMRRELSGERIDLGRELQATNTHAVPRDMGPHGATVDFRSTPLTPRDSLVVVAESSSPTLRITRIKWLGKSAS